jgi:hypothetical protein
MNDLTFGATLLSILVTLAAAVYVEATREPATRAYSPAFVHVNSVHDQAASSGISNCACADQVLAQAGSR